MGSSGAPPGPRTDGPPFPPRKGVPLDARRGRWWSIAAKCPDADAPPSSSDPSPASGTSTAPLVRARRMSSEAIWSANSCASTSDGFCSSESTSARICSCDGLLRAPAAYTRARSERVTPGRVIPGAPMRCGILLSAWCASLSLASPSASAPTTEGVRRSGGSSASARAARFRRLAEFSFSAGSTTAFHAPSGWSSTSESPALCVSSSTCWSHGSITSCCGRAGLAHSGHTQRGHFTVQCICRWLCRSKHSLWVHASERTGTLIRVRVTGQRRVRRTAVCSKPSSSSSAASLSPKKTRRIRLRASSSESAFLAFTFSTRPLTPSGRAKRTSTMHPCWKVTDAETVFCARRRKRARSAIAAISSTGRTLYLALYASHDAGGISSGTGTSLILRLRWRGHR
mmetsp:Transcript_10794/g.28017  ORF Transcript_10794/g.28017 Transcript_10794/m.28017 type:complete len:399 (+) Transcript_10794:143-1339(+)